MNIKDFILKDIDEIEEKQTKKRKQAEMVFNVEYENDTDFIISRKTPKTEKLLVFLISQGQFYIKDCKDNTITKITSANDIGSFKPNKYRLRFKVLSWEPWKYDGYCDRALIDYVLETPEIFKILSNKKLNPFANRHLVYQYQQDPDSFNNREKVLRMMRELNPNENMDYGWNDIVKTVLQLKIDINFIKKNKDLILELGYPTFKNLCKDVYFPILVNEYNCDLVSLLQYFNYTIKNKNRLSVGDYYQFRIKDYVDYLNMQRDMYGKIKEKYPVYWLSEKQILIGKYNAWRELKKDELIELNQENMRKYEFEDRYYKIIIPTTTADILDEASQQEHCLASYVNTIRDGRTNVVFIRSQLNLEQSCLTVEIRDGKIHQIKGRYNRRPTEDEMKFVDKWCKEKELEIAGM